MPPPPQASAYCISSGSYNTLALGDANGNIYIVRLIMDTDILTLPKSAFKNFPPPQTNDD